MTGLQSLTHNEFVFVSARYIYVLSVFVDLKQNVFVINGCWINVCWRNISWVVEMDKCKLMLIFYQKSCEPGGACWNGWISHLCKIIWRVAIFHIQALLKLVDLVDSWRLANSFSLANSTFSKYVCHSWLNEWIGCLSKRLCWYTLENKVFFFWRHILKWLGELVNLQIFEKSLFARSFFSKLYVSQMLRR